VKTDVKKGVAIRSTQGERVSNVNTDVKKELAIEEHM
jgi:hypothetical protein